MNNHRSSIVVAFIAILIYLAVPLWPIRAVEGNGLTPFPDFVTAVMDGQADVVRGVYAPGVLAFPVIQQAANDPGFVSETKGVVTQFGPPAHYNVVGLLAHNNLAGASFFQFNHWPGDTDRFRGRPGGILCSQAPRSVPGAPGQQPKRQLHGFEHE